MAALTHAGGMGASALLETWSTAVAGQAGDSILALALPCGLVANGANRANGMTLAGWRGNKRGRRC